MDIDATPVLDNHLHLDPLYGRGVAAVEEFAQQGGTHLLVLNKPSWHLVEAATDAATFREVFDLTVGAVEDATDVLPGRAWPVLGVHPALISTLVEGGHTPEAARDGFGGCSKRDTTTRSELHTSRHRSRCTESIRKRRWMRKCGTA